MEFKEDIQEALSFVRNDVHNCRVIALRPVVAYELDRRNVVYTNTLDYAGEDQRIRKGIGNFRIVEHLTTQIDNHLSHQLKYPSIKPGHFSFFYLKILFDVVITKIQLLKEIIETENPSEIVVFSHKPIKSSQFFPFYETESVFGYLLQLPGWGISVKNIEKRDTLPHPAVLSRIQIKTDLIRRLHHLTKRRNFLLIMGNILKKFGLTQSGLSFVRMCFSSKTHTVALHRCDYDWEYMLPDFFQ